MTANRCSTWIMSKISAGSDGNFVLTGDGAIVEAQISAEGATFDEEQLLRLLRLAKIGCTEIFKAQLAAARPKETKA